MPMLNLCPFLLSPFLPVFAANDNPIPDMSITESVELYFSQSIFEIAGEVATGEGAPCQTLCTSAGESHFHTAWMFCPDILSLRKSLACDFFCLTLTLIVEQRYNPYYFCSGFDTLLAAFEQHIIGLYNKLIIDPIASYSCLHYFSLYSQQLDDIIDYLCTLHILIYNLCTFLEFCALLPCLFT